MSTINPSVPDDVIVVDATPNVKYNLIALSVEFNDNTPPFKLNAENVNGVDNEPDSEYVN